ncbi:expressed unknown protein [Seminavis robusta]|uniref:Uncharacterized protein n=1 Tax=Seminavis robusta TaxID=568900 RepID=A0A9N8HNI8_9STRA|nr:expressed unknown protein [Seminavis robusta]|eukprot:Sro999_g229600.1 n/a (704) ;mRNA; r:5706-7914
MPGTPVARGQHVVPSGIAVEEFSDGPEACDRLTKECPDAVQTLLYEKKLQTIYVKFMEDLVKKGHDGKTWNIPALVEIVQRFQRQFVGIQVALCCLTSHCGSYRWYWIEYIDTTVQPAYKPTQFDLSGYQRVLHNSHAIPGNGSVAVHEMLDWSPKKFVSTVPQPVLELVQAKGATALYQKLIQTIYDSKTTRTWTGSWKTTEVLAIVKQFESEFQAFGLDIVVCKCTDPRDDWEYLKWLEIMDQTTILNYVPLYSVDDAKRKDVSERFSSTRGGNTRHAVEQLVVNGQPQLSENCPAAVVQMMHLKGLTTQDYEKLDTAIAASQSLRNFFDIWRLQDQGLIQFTPLEDFRSCFAKHGVRTILCESVGSNEGRNYWLEYIDMATTPNYSTPYNVNYGETSVTKKGDDEQQTSYKTVIHGHHKVPEGVVVEELGGVQKLTDPCSPEVLALLEEKDLLDVYQDCMKSIASAKSTRSWIRNWKSEEILAVLQEYEKPFAAMDVQVALCKLKPDKGMSYRWFEFIDTTKAKTYVPQYDVSSYDETLELLQTTLHFPKGIAVELLMDRKTVMQTVPAGVKTMMEAKDCMDLYNALVDVLCQSVVGDDNNDASEAHMKELTNVLGPKFETKGVSVYLSGKTEASLEGGAKSFFWVEFVDRVAQPNYVAQRGIDMKKLPTKGFSKEEALLASGFVALTLAEELLPLMFVF